MNKSWAPMVAVALTAWTGGAQETNDPFEVAFEAVTPAMTLVYRPNVWRYPVVGNAVILYTEKDVILVDGRGGQPVATQIVEHIRQTTDEPLTHLIVTHWHYDHTYNLEDYKSAFPGLRIVAHPYTSFRTLSDLVPLGERGAEDEIGSAAAARAELAGMDVDEADPVVKRAHEYHFLRIEDQKRITAVREAGSFAVPDIQVSDRMRIARESMTLDVRFLGVGNTPGDLVVWIPELETLIGGDIITSPVPFGFPRDQVALLETIDQILEMPFERLIPGHGAVLNGKGYVRQVRDLTRSTIASIDRLVSEGRTKREVDELVDFSDVETTWFADDPGMVFFFRRWYATPVVSRYYEESRRRHGLDVLDP